MKNSIKKTAYLVLGTAIAILFTGCGANGPQFTKMAEPKKDEGLVYIYRPSKFVGGGVYYRVNVTDKENENKVIGKLVNGSYLEHNSKKGEIEIWAETESKSSITLDVEAGKTYCVKGEVGIGFFVGRPHLSIVNNDLCEAEIKETKLSTEM